MSTKKPRTRGEDALSSYPYYPGDFEEGTSDFTLAEVGAYQRLINSQWAKGSIPGDNVGKLSLILRCTPATAKSVWHTVRSKFAKGTDGAWRNERLERERAAVLSSIATNSRRGKAGADARWGDKECSDDALSNAQACTDAVPKQCLSDSNPYPNDQNKERSDRTPVAPKAPNASSTAELRGRFDAFWAEYPSKKAKEAAWRRWQALKPSAELTATMLQAIRNQRTSRPWREGFVPHPATWLHDARWSDELERQVDRGETPMPFWDECATCGDIHPQGQPCPTQQTDSRKGAA